MGYLNPNRLNSSMHAISGCDSVSIFSNIYQFNKYITPFYEENKSDLSMDELQYGLFSQKKYLSRDYLP